jgi:hypothetical protein
MSMSVCQTHVQMEGHVRITSMATRAHVRRDIMAPTVSMVRMLLFDINPSTHTLENANASFHGNYL